MLAAVADPALTAATERSYGSYAMRQQTISNAKAKIIASGLYRLRRGSLLTMSSIPHDGTSARGGRIFIAS
jgi:hypothetical protein